MLPLSDPYMLFFLNLSLYIYLFFFFFLGPWLGVVEFPWEGLKYSLTVQTTPQRQKLGMVLYLLTWFYLTSIPLVLSSLILMCPGLTFLIFLVLALHSASFLQIKKKIAIILANYFFFSLPFWNSYFTYLRLLVFVHISLILCSLFFQPFSPLMGIKIG